MTEEQTALLEKAKRSLEGAQLLYDGGLYDFAISRAYYAMFYVAQVFLLSRGLAFSTHKATIAAFGKHFVHAGIVPVELHRFLIEAQHKRHSGDYETASDLGAEDAQTQIERAARFIAIAQEKL
jgi:uncharacterized protein (UPF0332 family)